MPRAARELSGSGIYHIVFRGINHQLLFEENADCEKLTEYLTALPTIIIKLIGAAVVLFILMHLIPFPVNRDYSAKQIWLNDPTYMEDCTISIAGYYHFNLFTGDTFTGQVTLSDYPLTAERMLPLTFGPDGSFLDYRYKLTPVGESLPATMSYDFGIIFSKPMMREVCIIAYTDPVSEAHGHGEPSGKGGSWNSTDGYCIVASVGSHKEAVDALKKYGLITAE